MRTRLLLCLLVVFAGACSSSSDAPTAPVAPKAPVSYDSIPLPDRCGPQGSGTGC
jgi:hypothetical protein